MRCSFASCFCDSSHLSDRTHSTPRFPFIKSQGKNEFKEGSLCQRVSRTSFVHCNRPRQNHAHFQEVRSIGSAQSLTSAERARKAASETRQIGPAKSGNGRGYRADARSWSLPSKLGNLQVSSRAIRPRTGTTGPIQRHTNDTQRLQ